MQIAAQTSVGSAPWERASASAVNNIAGAAGGADGALFGGSTTTSYCRPRQPGCARGREYRLIRDLGGKTAKGRNLGVMGTRSAALAPNWPHRLIADAERPLDPSQMPVSPAVSADASARAMSSADTISADGSDLARSARSGGATVCSRRARSRLQAMTTLRA